MGIPQQTRLLKIKNIYPRTLGRELSKIGGGRCWDLRAASVVVQVIAMHKQQRNIGKRRQRLLADARAGSMATIALTFSERRAGSPQREYCALEMGDDDLWTYPIQQPAIGGEDQIIRRGPARHHLAHKVLKSGKRELAMGIGGGLEGIARCTLEPMRNWQKLSSAVRKIANE